MCIRDSNYTNLYVQHVHVQMIDTSESTEAVEADLEAGIGAEKKGLDGQGHCG